MFARRFLWASLESLCLAACCSIVAAQASSSKPSRGDGQAPIPYSSRDLHPGPAWFVDVAQEAGLRMQNVNGGVTTKKYIIETTGSGVAILDYDHDGWPDIFLVNGDDLEPGANRTGRPMSHLYRNNHDG